VEDTQANPAKSTPHEVDRKMSYRQRVGLWQADVCLDGVDIGCATGDGDRFPAGVSGWSGTARTTQAE
jgi:hypothetical protein